MTDFPNKPSECENRKVVQYGEGRLDSLVIYYTARTSWLTAWIFEVVGRTDDDELIFESDSDTPWVPVSPDVAVPLVRGSLKWDGCSDVDIGGDVMSYRNHFCGRSGAKVVGIALDALYDLGAETIEAWDEEIAS